MTKIRLGVNIDHCATLRQVRGGTTPYPDIGKLAKIAVEGGAQQITIHLREDRRHIQDRDLELLAKQRPALLNLEIAATPEMLRKALKHKPDWVCFVPEKRAELTTEGGLDVRGQKKNLGRMTEKLRTIGIEVSMFIEASPEQVRASAEVFADAVELHTGKWCESRGLAKKREWKRLVAAAQLAHELGLKVHAGHGLDYQTSKEIRRLPYLAEVNIGHSLVCYALEFGLKKSVRQMRQILDGKKV